MRTYPVVFAPEFVEQLESLYDYIAEEASPYIAARYTDAILEYCESLSTPWIPTRSPSLACSMAVGTTRRC